MTGAIHTNESGPARIAAVIVAFNRLSLLRDCVWTLRHQTRPPEGIIVVDNESTDGTAEWLAAQPGLHAVTQRNAGSAGGFARGLRMAVDMGYDWVWLMDDDCLPDQCALESLVRHLDTPGVTALACAVCNPGRGVNPGHALRRPAGYSSYPHFGIPVPVAEYGDNPIPLDIATYTGLLVPAQAVRTCGVPLEKLFIHYDDTEYTLRLARAGRLLLVPGAVMNHLSAAAAYFTETHRPRYDALWITYFGNRNRVWLARHCGLAGARLLLACLKGLLRKTLDILRLDKDHRAKRILLEWLAVHHGFFQKFDNHFPRRFLYGERDPDSPSPKG